MTEEYKETETVDNDFEDNDNTPMLEITNHLPNGRFAPGNRAGKGRPPKQRELSYLYSLKLAVKQDDIETIGNKVKEQALNGHFPSQQLLFNVLVPREIQLLQLKENQMFMLANIFTRFRLAGVEVSEILSALNEQSLRLLNTEND